MQQEGGNMIVAMTVDALVMAARMSMKSKVETAAVVACER